MDPGTLGHEAVTAKHPFLDFLVGGAMYRAVDASIRRFVAVVLVTHDVTMLGAHATKDKPSLLPGKNFA